MSVTCSYITAEGVSAKVLFSLCCALTRVIARTSVHMKMSRRAETITAAAIPATARVLREEPLLEMDIVVVLCWVGLVGVVETIARDSEEGDKVEVVVVLCWVGLVGVDGTITVGSEGGYKMEAVDRSSKEDIEEVVKSVQQEKLPAGYYYMNIHERISSYK